MGMRSLGAVLATVALVAATPSDPPLADAAMQGNVEAVRALVTQGADPDAAHGDGMTALHWAAERGHAEIAQILLDAGADTEAVTRIGAYTPLHLAARSGAKDVTKALLAAGANPRARSTTGGSTPLHFAATAGSVSAIEALVGAGADVDAREEARGQTALMFAAASGRYEAVRTLLEQGADPSLQSAVLDLSRQAALDRMARQRRNEVLAQFRALAGPDNESWRPTPEQSQAAIKAARELLKELELSTVQTREGDQSDEPDPNVQGQEGMSGSYADLVGAQGGMTALHYAIREGHPETAFLLIDRGADINQPSGGDHTSPLLSAVINGHFDLALDLLDRGADPTIESAAGTTPLFTAINTQWAPKARYPQQEAYKQQQATYLDLMKGLLEAGADPNVRLNKHLWFMEYTFSHLGINTTGATPFWRAAHALDVEAMKLLVAHGADPHIPTIKVPGRRYGRGGPAEDPSGLPPVPIGGPAVYPIHIASGHGYGTGYAGNSHRHVPDGWMAAVRYLVEEHGADVNARDDNGYSPLHNAASRGDTDMIRYLVDKGADVMVVSRRGQTTVDMANGPQQRIQPFPEAMALLESLGAKNNHNCLSCQ